MTIGIYCIEHPASGKKYIGRSVNIERRWKNHKLYLLSEDKKHSNIYLASAVKKHGFYSLLFYILERFETRDLKQLADRENYWMDFYKTHDRNFGYNLRRDTHSGLYVSDETRERMSAARRGKPLPREQVEKTRSANIGMKMSDEAKRKISIAMTGKKASEATRKKMSESHKGVPLSESHKASLRKCMLGRAPKDRDGNLLSELRRGIPLSDETKKKMSESALKREANKQFLKLERLLVDAVTKE